MSQPKRRLNRFERTAMRRAFVTQLRLMVMPGSSFVQSATTALAGEKGRLACFPSLQSIYDDFTGFWNLLAYQQIAGGSLNTEFSTTLKASRELHRVISLLNNANLPLRRNKYNTDLQPIIRLIFEDIADQNELDILQRCYIHTGTLKTVANDLNMIITEAIPKFLTDDGAKPVGADHHRGGFLRSIKDAVAITRGELFLLLGGIGSGKSTFLKRYQKTIGKTLLDEKSLWFLVDFIRPPDEPMMEHFVWSKVLDDLRSRYKHHECEKKKYLKEVFADDIAALELNVLSGFKEGTHKYETELSKYLHEWTSDLSRYVPKLVQVTCKRLGLKPVLFIDNVDQLSPDYQAKIFLLAQHVTGAMSSISIVALREESYYTANMRRTFTAYSTRRFHIASPLFKPMIANRIEYALKRLEKQQEDDQITPREEYRRQSIVDFLKIVEGGILENVRIGRFIQSLCYGNMRLALEMFSTFLVCGTTDVGKMLNIYGRDGWYNIAYHEFVKAIMLEDRSYYKDEASKIGNIFNVGSEPNSSHFTSWRIILSLLEHRGVSSPEGIGYLELSRMVVAFENVFDNVQDFLAAMNRMVRRHLIEPNTRSPESVKDASHVRVTSAGWYYIRHLVPTFAYLDLVLQDTPLNDPSLEKQLRQSVYDVNNLPDEEDQKLERVRSRFKRVELFLDYLVKEEAAERAEFGLDRIDSPLAKPIMKDIKASFESEREWIDRRLRENRERYKEEYVVDGYEEEEQEVANQADDVDEDEDATDSPPQSPTTAPAKPN